MSDTAIRTVAPAPPVDPLTRFVARVAHANAYFFALSAEEIGALPDGAARGLVELRNALSDLRGEPTEITTIVPDVTDASLRGLMDAQRRVAWTRAAEHFEPTGSPST